MKQNSQGNSFPNFQVSCRSDFHAIQR